MFGNPHEKLQAGFRGYLLAGVAEELRDWRILFDNTGVAEGARCVETHRLVNRNQHVARMEGGGGGIATLLVALADDAPTLDAGAREHQRVAVRPVVAPPVLVDLRRAAKLTAEDDEC